MKRGDKVTVLTAVGGVPLFLGTVSDAKKAFVSVSRGKTAVVYHFNASRIRPTRPGDEEAIKLNERMDLRARRLREIADILEEPHGRADMVEDVISALNHVISEISKEFN